VPPRTTKKPVSPPAASAKERAYDYIKGEILGATLGEGEFLTEEGLATALGISRTPVREALLRLDAEGLLTLVPRKGAFVRPVTQREISEVIEVRALVERFAAKQLCDPDFHQRRKLVAESLAALLREQTELATRNDAAGFIDRDRRFHAEIVAGAGNLTLVDLYQRLRDQQLRMGIRAVTADHDRYESVVREHEAVVEAVASGDADAVAAALNAHLETTRQLLLARMGSAR
jgi:DNA-binding GntR family transcriptional regulator